MNGEHRYIHCRRRDTVVLYSTKYEFEYSWFLLPHEGSQRLTVQRAHRQGAANTLRMRHGPASAWAPGDVEAPRVHGSWGNRSTTPRRAIVLNFFAHGTRSYMEGHLMKGLPAVGYNEALVGQFHPVVFDTTRVDMTTLPVAGA